MSADKARMMLEADEGLRLKPYRCTAGKLTIGVGRNLDDVGISKATAYQMLDEDILTAQGICERIFAGQFAGWSENRRLGWVNLAFNLGQSRLLQFRNTIRAARANDWVAVESGLRGSLWFKQVKSRAERVIRLVCYEEFPYA